MTANKTVICDDADESALSPSIYLRGMQFHNVNRNAGSHVDPSVFEED